MTISHRKNSKLCGGLLTTMATFGLIVATSQGWAVRAQAEDATADYAAPLDMTSSYPGPFEYPEFLPEALVRRAMAVPGSETTGLSSGPWNAAHMDAPTQQQASNNGADMSDDKYDR